jgi:uncharacterized protein YbjT (DUF2867 family)
VGSAHERTGIPHFDSKWRIEEAVRGLRFPSHVILRPVFFMENLLAPFSLPRHEVRARNGALLSEGVVGGRRPDVRIAP